MVALRSIFTIIFALEVFMLSAQEVKPRVAGLENNQEYMSLLAKDANLQKSSDSLANAIITLRERFAEQSGNRKELSASILKLESESFQVQSERSRTIQRINAIEQDWIVVNMNSSPAPKIPVEEPKVYEDDNAVLHFVNQITDINEEANTELNSSAVIVNHEVEQHTKKIVKKEEIDNFVMIDGVKKEKTDTEKEQSFNRGSNAFKNSTNFLNSIKEASNVEENQKAAATAKKTTTKK
jgi:hypothetical protein